MKEMIMLLRTQHNGLKCYKDETKVFAVMGSRGKWKLYRAVEHNDNITNELGSWGYRRIYQNETFNTIKECIAKIEDIIKNGYWNDDYQRNLINKFYLG